MYILANLTELTENETMELRGISNETGFFSILDMPNTLKIFQDMVNVINRIRHKVNFEQSR